MVKIPKAWVGKKSETNPDKKNQHEVRKYKLVYLAEIREKEQQQEIKDLFNADTKIQEYIR